MFTVEVENQTEYAGVFALAAIAEGCFVDDLPAACRGDVATQLDVTE